MPKWPEEQEDGTFEGEEDFETEYTQALSWKELSGMAFNWTFCWIP